MFIENITKEVFTYIDEQLMEYNAQRTNLMVDKVFESMYKGIKSDGKLIGGISGDLELKSALHITRLWIDDSVRGQNIGTKLLNDLEVEAIQKGATFSYTETYDFQAKGFYIKNGYEIFASLEYQSGNTIYYLKKNFNL